MASPASVKRQAAFAEGVQCVANFLRAHRRLPEVSEGRQRARNHLEQWSGQESA